MKSASFMDLRAHSQPNGSDIDAAKDSHNGDGHSCPPNPRQLCAAGAREAIELLAFTYPIAGAFFDMSVPDVRDARGSWDALEGVVSACLAHLLGICPECKAEKVQKPKQRRLMTTSRNNSIENAK